MWKCSMRMEVSGRILFRSPWATKSSARSTWRWRRRFPRASAGMCRAKEAVSATSRFSRALIQTMRALGLAGTVKRKNRNLSLSPSPNRNQILLPALQTALTSSAAVMDAEALAEHVPAAKPAMVSASA